MAHHRLVTQMFSQMVCRLTNFTLTGQENQDITGSACAPQLIYAIGNRIIEIVVAAFFKRSVALLHRKHAPRHHDDGRRCEHPALCCGLQTRKVVGKTLGVNGGRGDDHFQVGSARQYLAQIP